VTARFVGHPLADQFPLEADRASARAALGLAADDEVVALLPGSRMGEVSRLAQPFVGAAAWLAARRPAAKFVAPLTNAATRECFEATLGAAAAAGAGVPVQVLEGQSRAVLAAADVVLVASGTATLETLLTRRPMVVAYRLAPLTAFLLRRLRLVKVRHFSQPNLLVGREVVPEFFQEAATPAALGAALLHWLEAPQARTELSTAFAAVHRDLRRGGAGLAAEAVLELLQERSGSNRR
jgi:lipid-A-disaccharide synthase